MTLHGFIEPLADKFYDLLKLQLTTAELREVVSLNREEESADVCHSHDFTDANMVMDAAFKSVVGREPDLSKDGDLQLWNAAWNYAVRTHLS